MSSDPADCGDPKTATADDTRIVEVQWRRLEPMSDDDAPRPSTLVAELLFDAPAPSVDADLLGRAARAHDRTARVVNDPERMMIAHQQWTLPGPDGVKVPLVTAMLVPDPDAEPRSVDTSQSWLFDGAADAVAATVDRRLVLQMMGLSHPAADRRAAFLAGLRAIIDALNPRAVSLPGTAQVLSPQQVLDEELLPFVNVRLYNISNENAMLMDTVGLDAFALPDLQCHFRDLDPSAMARLLYNTAGYVLSNGDVIEDGNTIPGVAGDEHWRCQHELALVEPTRMVLDIDPGERFAAGRRNRP